MPKRIQLYHGSDKIVERPELDKGSAKNDYGQGFYCTMHYELACEWASKNEAVNGYANEYELDLSGLKVLDLSDPAYNILNWITLLIQNRTFTSTTPISKQAQAYLIENFSSDVSDYDLIKGYRADDSYFSFAKDFVNNTISVQQLAKAMKLGKLGIQYAAYRKGVCQSDLCGSAGSRLDHLPRKISEAGFESKKRLLKEQSRSDD